MARLKKNEINQRTGFVSIDLAFKSKDRITLVSLSTRSNTHVSTNRVAKRDNGLEKLEIHCIPLNLYNPNVIFDILDPMADNMAEDLSLMMI